MELAKDRVQWRAMASAALNLTAYYHTNIGNPLTRSLSLPYEDNAKKIRRTSSVFLTKCCKNSSFLVIQAVIGVRVGFGPVNASPKCGLCELQTFINNSRFQGCHG
jgi:hypothetical protein